jgi:glycerol-3-phosphate acyltransferase PlsY
MTYLFAVVAAYLLGSIPVRPWFGKVRKGLIRTPAAEKELWILASEMAKGVLAASAGFLLAGWTGASLAAVAVVFGEIVPLGSARRRGNGAATAAGALFVLSPLLIFIGALIYFLSLLITRYPPFSILCAAIGVLLFGLILSVHLYVWLVILCLVGLILLRPGNGRNRYFSGRNPFRWRPFR